MEFEVQLFISLSMTKSNNRARFSKHFFTGFAFTDTDSNHVTRGCSLIVIVFVIVVFRNLCNSVMKFKLIDTDAPLWTLMLLIWVLSFVYIFSNDCSHRVIYSFVNQLSRYLDFHFCKVAYFIQIMLITCDFRRV